SSTQLRRALDVLTGDERPAGPLSAELR
ncbi:cytidyltransferase, partial [Streptomyces sp. SID11233]|nr:cytidyltransferase [Streptomyces sp. SID11233]